MSRYVYTPQAIEELLVCLAGVMREGMELEKQHGIFMGIDLDSSGISISLIFTNPHIIKDFDSLRITSALEVSQTMTETERQKAQQEFLRSLGIDLGEEE